MFRSCILEIYQYLQRLLETRDSMLTTLVCQHLSEKLNPVFPMLNQLEGVSGSEFILKQGGDNADKKTNPQGTTPTKAKD